MFHDFCLLGIEANRAGSEGVRRARQGNWVTSGKGGWTLSACQRKGKRPLVQQPSALLGIEDANHSVLAVVTWLNVDFAAAHSTQRFCEQRRAFLRQLLERSLGQQGQLRTHPFEQSLVGAPHPHGAGSCVDDFADHLVQWDEVMERLRIRRPKAAGPVGQLHHPTHHSPGQALSALRAHSLGNLGLFGRQHDAALSVSIEMVLSLLGKEFNRSEEAFASTLQRRSDCEIGHFAIE